MYKDGIKDKKTPKQKSVSEYSKKKPAKKEASKILPANIFNAFYASMPPSTFVSYTRDLDLSELSGDLASVTYKTIMPLDNIASGEALFLTNVRVDYYYTTFEIFFPFRVVFTNRVAQRNSGTCKSLGYELVANNVALLNSSNIGTPVPQTIPPTFDVPAAGTNMNGENILNFGLMKTVVCVPENTNLGLYFKAFFFDDYGTSGQLPAGGWGSRTDFPSYAETTPKYATAKIKGFKTTMKVLKEFQEKYNF